MNIKHSFRFPVSLRNICAIWGLGIALIVALSTVAARAETPDEWIKLSNRFHGTFGSLIPVGIRIGLDALETHSQQKSQSFITTATRHLAPV